MRCVNSTVASSGNQQGAALPLVLILMILMFILSAAAYQVSQGNTGIVAMASSSEKALYAAEQGYNRTLWRLNNEKTNFLAAEDSSPEEIYYGGKPYNLYKLTAGSNYRVQVLVPLVEIAGSTDKAEDSYRRIIRATGWDNRYPERLRSIEVEVYKKTFTQFCMANNSERDKAGNPLYWTTGEVVYGPLHTNDTLFVNGTPIFHGPVTYVNSINITPAGNMYNPAIFRKGNSKVAEVLSFNSSLSNLKAHARIAGHYYNGRACIRLLESGGYNVRYYDRSTDTWHYNDAEYHFVPTTDRPLTNNKWYDREIANEEAYNSNAVMFQRIFRNEDGSIQDTLTQSFRSFAAFAATVSPLKLPENGVVYVDGGTGGNDAAGVSKYDVGLGNVFVSGKLDGRLTIAAANDIFITAHDPCDWKRPDWSSSWYDSAPGVTYSNTTFEQIMVNGEWSHTEVGGNSGEDMLGLAATNHVDVLHYNWSSQYDENVDFFGSILDPLDLFTYRDYCWTFMNLGVPVDHAPNNINLHAAICAQEESFGFEAYDRGRVKDTAYVVGSIAQKYRGPQGISGFLDQDGYKKSYSHDPRFLYDAPPHFPDPANSGWQSSRWDELKNHIE
ncbi:DUF4900 domain-containing protein [Syntrophomonas curvata]